MLKLAAILLMISAPGDDILFDGVRSKSTFPGMPAQIQINLTLDLKSSGNLSMELESLNEEEGVYAVAVNTITTGSPDARTSAQDYIVFDDHYQLPNHKAVTFALFDNDIYVMDKPRTAFVMEWPSERNYPNNKQLIAMKRALEYSRDASYLLKVAQRNAN